MPRERLELQHLVYLNEDNGKDLLSKFVAKFSCPFLGLFLATLSSFFFSLCSVIVKWLQNVHPMQLAAFRFLGVLLPTIPILIHNGSNAFPEGKRIILLLRCFVGTMGLMLAFFAFRHMSLSDASVIIFSTPVFVVIFAKLFLNESCGVFNIITIFFTLMGVIFITRPPLLFDTIETNPSLYPKDSLFRNSSSVDLLDEGDKDLQSTKQFDIWGPVAAISSTLFGAVNKLKFPLH